MPATTTEMLARLVAFESVSGRSNLELIAFLREYLDAHGVAYRVTRDAPGQKGNIQAIIGPQTGGGVALSGHLDVVPVAGQAWSSDPFTLRHNGDRLHARGACDMKGFIASCLTAVPDFLAMPLQRPLHLFFSYDEETDCGGARRLIADMQETALKPELCIVGEPSSMKPIIAHKGRLAMTVTVRGRPGHTSQPGHGVNAVHAAAEAITLIAAEARRMAKEGPFEEGFEPPHSTIVANVLHGGHTLNIIPEHAEFSVEYRNVPADDPDRRIERLKTAIAETIEPDMHAVDPKTGFTWHLHNRMPCMQLDPNHDLVTVVKQIIGSNQAGKVSYGTEGGYYQEAGIATIICGPGDIMHAHQPDEFVTQGELDACDTFIRRLAQRMLT